MPRRFGQVTTCYPAIALFLGSVLVPAGTVHANLLLNETRKLTAGDASAEDQFGFSVAISGGIALVGSEGDDDVDENAGAAYLFDVATGSQLFKLAASDAGGGDQFGKFVGIDGNIAIVGAFRDDDGGRDSGSAYLFDITTGGQLFKLSATDAAAGKNFGVSVAVSGNTAIVGAELDDAAGYYAGSAYLFDVTTGGQLFKLIADDTAAEDLFGSAVAISGNTAIVGALSADDDGQNSGAAYLFDVTTGHQIRKLTASDAEAGDVFGNSVGISGNIAIVGAVLDDDATGSAYLFDVTTGQQIAKLTASDAALGDRFGHSVAISGNLAVVGANNDADAGGSSGSAYLFDVTTGQQIAKLTASDAAIADQFGCYVGVSGDTAIVGAFLDDDAGVASGSAYLFVVPEPVAGAAMSLGLVAVMGGRPKR